MARGCPSVTPRVQFMTSYQSFIDGLMFWFIVSSLFSLWLDVFRFRRVSITDQQLEIFLLRQQLHILQRQLKQPPRLCRLEKLSLAVLTVKVKQWAKQPKELLERSILLFQPTTVLKWHWELVKRKWTFSKHKQMGRPRTPFGLEQLVLQLTRENADWGYGKIQGELLKLGYEIGETTIRDILARNGIPAQPQRRQRKSAWRVFLNHYKQQLLACDFFTVETLWLKTIYVLFFIELGTRRVHLAGCTEHPNSAWVTQQARQLTWTLADRSVPVRFLIHDRDTKFSAPFDAVFAAEQIETVLTPFRAPKANAFAERWIRSARQECLDHLLILNERHLHRVLNEYIDYYNRARPHQGIGQHTPVQRELTGQGSIDRRDVLGGLIHDYYREAA